MSLEQKTQEHIADATTTIAIGSWTVSLADINMILETATFALGFVAGAFALFFQIRRYIDYRNKLKSKNDDAKE